MESGALGLGAPGSRIPLHIHYARSCVPLHSQPFVQSGQIFRGARLVRV